MPAFLRALRKSAERHFGHKSDLEADDGAHNAAAVTPHTNTHSISAGLKHSQALLQQLQIDVSQQTKRRESPSPPADVPKNENTALDPVLYGGPVPKIVQPKPSGPASVKPPNFWATVKHTSELVDMPVKVPEFQVDRPQVPLGSGAASKAFFIDEIMHQIIESVKIGDKAVWRALALTHSSITADAQSRLVQFLVLETAKQWLRLIDMLRNNTKFRPWIKDLTFRTYGTGYDIMLLPVTPGFTAMIEELFPALHTVSVDWKVILDKNFVFRLPALRNLYVHYRAFWNVSWVDHETEYPLQGEDKDSLAPLQLDFLCLDMYSHEDRGAPRSGAKCCIDLDGWLTTSGALRNVRSIKFFLHVMRDFCELAYVLAECTKLEEIEFNGVYGRNTWKERREDNPKPFPYHQMALRSKTLRSITYEAGHQSDCMVALADLFNGSALPTFRQLNLVTFDPNHQPIPSFEPEIMREFLERRTGRENAVQRLDDKLMAQMELIDLRFVCGPMPDIEIFLENFGPANRPEVLKVTWNEPVQAHDTNRVWTS